MDICIRPPVSTEGQAVNQLVYSIPELDSNSTYCNLLQCSHFAATSAIACEQSRVLGFVSGYRLPERPEVLFIWQVAVSPQARGQKLASRMLQHLLMRPQNLDVQFIETTITADNDASWALFNSIARHYQCTGERSVMFDKDSHFAGQHDSEFLFRIGPFQRPANQV